MQNWMKVKENRFPAALKKTNLEKKSRRADVRDEPEQACDQLPERAVLGRIGCQQGKKRSRIQ
jgi:hypothetical protein